MISEKSNMQILRKSKGLTQQKMSDILGISKQRYARFENGGFKNKDAVEILGKFADFFGVTVDYLLNRSSSLDNEIHGILNSMNDDQKEWVLCTIKTFLINSNDKNITL